MAAAREAPAVVSAGQPTAREGEAGPLWVTDGSVAARIPGNAGGAKGPCFERDV